MQRNLEIGLSSTRITFQFPSSGKVYAKEHQRRGKEIDLEVSIPFEREGVCKAIVTFQNDEQILKLVSIPFEREGVCKVTSGRRTTERVKKFQFPSSGKVYAKSIKIEGGIDASDKFQFPSSGKVYAKVV